MDYNSVASALQQDLGVSIPGPQGLKDWRQSWTERALGDPLFDSTFSQLFAAEFLSKCKGLPGVNPQSHLDKFLRLQSQVADRLVARDRTLDAVTDGCRWLLGNYDHGNMVRFATHGPGATADGLSSFDKWLMKPPLGEISDRFDPLKRMPRSSSFSKCNRFAEVPKTSWSNRGICLEDTCAQFFQQGIGRMLRFSLLSSGCDLRTQWKTNVSLLRDPDYHTIDLAAASDSISVAFAKSVFVGPKLEPWLAAMSEVRADFCSVPSARGQTLIKLNTFASMGNGYCFQLLSVLCMAMCIASIRETYPLFPWNRASVLDEFHRHFSVYGDDIVVHSRYRPALYYVLSACGFEVNTSKSSTDGLWRESCGAFVKHEPSGYRITTSVPRLRSYQPDDPESLVSLCSLQRDLVKRGWDSTAEVLADLAVTSKLGRSVVCISREDFSSFPLVASDPFGSSLVVVHSQQRSSRLKWSSTRCRAYLRANRYVKPSRPLELADSVATAACLAGGGFLPPSEHYGNTCLLQQARVYA